MTTHNTASDLYSQFLSSIRGKIDALRKLTGDRFGHDPDAIHWGHVGDLDRVNQALDDLLAIVGEHNAKRPGGPQIPGDAEPPGDPWSRSESASACSGA